MFADRHDAAERLARVLRPYAGRRPLVLGIPRGGVPLAAHVAAELGGDLDVVLVRKLGAPDNPELALGAVDESGRAWMTPQAPRFASEAYLENEKRRQLAIIAERRASYSGGRPALDPRGRVVIVVDDGLATGATMTAALHGLREQQPEELIVAVPVAHPDTVARIRPLCDELVCLLIPSSFAAVGQFYYDFTPVEDREVMATLRDHSVR